MDFSLILESFRQTKAELQMILEGAGRGQTMATVILTGTFLVQECVSRRLAS